MPPRLHVTNDKHAHVTVITNGPSSVDDVDEEPTEPRRRLTRESMAGPAAFLPRTHRPRGFTRCSFVAVCQHCWECNHSRWRCGVG